MHYIQTYYKVSVQSFIRYNQYLADNIVALTWLRSLITKLPVQTILYSAILDIHFSVAVYIKLGASAFYFDIVF